MTAVAAGGSQRAGSGRGSQRQVTQRGGSFRLSAGLSTTAPAADGGRGGGFSRTRSEKRRVTSGPPPPPPAAAATTSSGPPPRTPPPRTPTPPTPTTRIAPGAAAAAAASSASRRRRTAIGREDDRRIIAEEAEKRAMDFRNDNEDDDDDADADDEEGGDSNEVDGEREKDENAEDGEEGEEEEEEPRLKYLRLGSSIPEILQADGAGCICVAHKMIGLGTRGGIVHLLDFHGDEVKRYVAHKSVVNEISFDAENEYVASCSDDGTVVINGLYTDEHEKYEYGSRVNTVALDPEFTKTAKGRRFVSGGMAGQLLLNSRGWLGSRDQVLHGGEGPIYAVRWRNNLIAWANDLGVKVYDTATSQRISFIERPKRSPKSEILQPHLVWQDDLFLIIGWGDWVKIAAVQMKGEPEPDLAAKDGIKSFSPSMPAVPGVGALVSSISGISIGAADLLGLTNSNGKNGIAMAGPKHMEIVAMFRTDYGVAGVAPYGDELVMLAYVGTVASEENVEATVETPLGAENGNGTAVSTPPVQAAQRPEIRIVTWKNEELTSDALSVNGYEQFRASDYALGHVPTYGGSSMTGGQRASGGDEPLYYILSPKDVILAKPRDAEDHVKWLLQHGRYEKALRAVEAGGTRAELVDEVGARYLDHLLLQRKYADAAALCPKLLRGNIAAWERWVSHFKHLRQLPVLAPYIPTSSPQLTDTVYEVVLDGFLISPAFYDGLLSTVRSWPASIYTISRIINAVQGCLSKGPDSTILQEVLAELYLLDKQFGKTLTLLLQLQRPNVFDFMDQHNLYGAVYDKIVLLTKLDPERAVGILVQHLDEVPVSSVVTQLEQAKPVEFYRPILHKYLHAVFEKDSTASVDFHGLQVELYADYDRRFLLPFLRSSQHYDLDKAYRACSKRGLTKEVVFILGRMGNAREALWLIIDELHDVQQAIEFVTSQNDDDLWEELINHAKDKPEMVGSLLEHTVGNINPLHLMNKLPSGLPIPRLRDRLVKIITDYRTEMSLRQGCNDILKADCVTLLIKYFNEARHAIRVGEEGAEHMRMAKPDKQQSHVAGSGTVSASGSFRHDSAAGDVSSVLLKPGGGGGLGAGCSGGAAVAMQRHMGGSGRCCVCLDPVTCGVAPLVAFFCAHAYHLRCLKDMNNSISGRPYSPPEASAASGSASASASASTSASASASTSTMEAGDSSERARRWAGKGGESEDEEENERVQSHQPQLQCIVCTAAAAVKGAAGGERRAGRKIMKRGPAGFGGSFNLTPEHAALSVLG